MIYILAGVVIAIVTLWAVGIEYADSMPVYMNPEVPPVPDCPPEYRMN